MSEFNESLSQLKEKLRADMDRVLGDADLLLHSVVESADTKVSAARARVDETLNGALEKLMQFDLQVSEKTSQGTQHAMQEVSAAVKHAVESGKAAIVAAEHVGQDVARKGAVNAIGAMKEAVAKASKAIQDATKKMS